MAVRYICLLQNCLEKMQKINPFSLLTLLLLLIASSAFGQTENVGINTLTPDSSALLDLESNDKGFLQPRLSSIERDAIPAPAIGLSIFNTTDSTDQYYNGECWLNSFQQNCDDCFFSFSASSQADTIDRTQTDSVTISFTINQTTGNPQNIAFAIVNQLPQGMTASVTPNPLFSSGTATLTIKVTPFTPDGFHPIIIQTLCGASTFNFIYSLYLEPCYELDINNNQTAYIMSVDLYTTYPQLLLNPFDPVCVVAEVQPGVTLNGLNPNLPILPTLLPSIPAFVMGPLPAGSVVAVVNNGDIYGAAGNGGIATDPILGLTGAGGNGGDAITLSANTSVLNNGIIFGGGGGGHALAFQIGIPLGPIFFGFLIGSGGGGGAGGGLGGNIPTLIGIQFYSPGFDGTAGPGGVPGQGGILQVPINIQQGPVSITINPNVVGGGGGIYGFSGTQGVFQVSLSASIIVNIPFVGPVTIPIITNLNIPIPLPIPAVGRGGFAIRRNGNNVNFPDQLYNTAFLKGEVGN